VFGQPYLTGPSSAPAAAIARTYIAANQDLFALTDEQVEQLVVARDYVTAANGAQHVAFEQRIDGIRVANRTLTFLLDRDGRIVSVGGPLARGRTVGSARGCSRHATRWTSRSTRPPSEAEIDLARRRRRRSCPAGGRGNVERFDNTFADVQNPNPVTAEPVWYETEGGTLRPPTRSTSRSTATTGSCRTSTPDRRVLDQWNRYAHAAPQGTVFTGQHPNDSPARSVQPFSGTNGSWVDGDVTSGPNVNAYRDLDNSNTVGYRPDPSTGG
jgi:hypothetical protein